MERQDFVATTTSNRQLNLLWEGTIVRVAASSTSINGLLTLDWTMAGRVVLQVLNAGHS